MTKKNLKTIVRSILEIAYWLYKIYNLDLFD